MALKVKVKLEFWKNNSKMVASFFRHLTDVWIQWHGLHQLLFELDDKLLNPLLEMNRFHEHNPDLS